ncbi:uncharacterized protein PG998_015103 [Apiospora kogelbergensis]|uniref:uncharacterized protein n=1 Tax=Apiospora kogelbergensis TaxID=1337665 RepID=UPI00312FB73C
MGRRTGHLQSAEWVTVDWTGQPPSTVTGLRNDGLHQSHRPGWLSDTKKVLCMPDAPSEVRGYMPKN